MAQPYVGEIRMFAGIYAPDGWLFCDGQLLPISNNEVLFQLIGTTYGGDGQETFALPDLRGRIPIHFGGPIDAAVPPTTGQISMTGGVETVTLTPDQIPTHTHAPVASNAGATLAPTNALLAVPTSTQAGLKIYNNGSTVTPNTTLTPGSISPAGGSQPHENMMPYLSVNFILSLFGIFPSPT